MAFKAVKYLLMLTLLWSSLNGKAQQLNPDSVVQQVFDALTGDAVALPIQTKEMLIGPEWEALAYWDMNDPRQLDYMQEAVGDVYQFQPTSFVIKLVDPNNPRTYHKAITGSFALAGRNISLTASSGKELKLTIILLDANYLVLEMDGLRLFFTKSRSYNAQ